MNKQELIESISHLPSDCSGPRPMIDKLTALELIKLLDEPQKVTVPQFVAEVIEGAKEESSELEDLFRYIWFNEIAEEFTEWYGKKSNRDLFVRAWLDGFTVEKEKRYEVKMKGVEAYSNCLNHDTDADKWYWSNDVSSIVVNTDHTRKELEEAGFGWVFDCEGMEVKEVEVEK